MSPLAIRSRWAPASEKDEVTSFETTHPARLDTTVTATSRNTSSANEREAVPSASAAARFIPSNPAWESCSTSPSISPASVRVRSARVSNCDRVVLM
jgi:hypothetical protein